MIAACLQAYLAARVFDKNSLHGSRSCWNSSAGLYELLTGQTPQDAQRLRACAYAEILRIIKEEEPPRPSTKISALGEQATIIAQLRHPDARQLRRDLAGEPDWIVMKCLEKDRTRRYETANGLVRDIERYLRDEPVEACPPLTAYSLSKYWRKHRGLLTTAAAFVALLITGATISAWLAVRATLAERRAQTALVSEQAARAEAEKAKAAVEKASERLRRASQLANDGAEYHYRCNWAAAQKSFAEAEAIESDLRAIYVHPGAMYTALGLWDRAAGDYERSFELGSRSNCSALYERALLKRLMGDDAGYRRVCQEMAQYLRNNGDTHSWLRACVLSPTPPGDSAKFAQAAERLVANWYVPWVLGAAALAHVRAGNYERQSPAVRRPCGFQ